MKLKDYKDWGKLVERKEDCGCNQITTVEEGINEGFNDAHDELGELSVSIDEDKVQEVINDFFEAKHDNLAKALANTNIIKITKEDDVIYDAYKG